MPDDAPYLQPGEVGERQEPGSGGKQHPIVPLIGEREITPDKLKSIELRGEMVRLTRAGLLPAEVASVLSERHDVTLTASTVDRQVKEYLRASYSNEDVDAVRALFRERFESLIRSRWTKAVSGDDAAFDRIVNAMKEEAKLLGLNMPVKAEVNGRLETDITMVAQDILTNLAGKKLVESQMGELGGVDILDVDV